MKYVFIFAAGFNEASKKLREKFDITETKKGEMGLIKFEHNNDEYIIREFFGSNVFKSKEFKGADKVILLGLCYGLKGVNKGDYCLPVSYTALEHDLGGEYKRSKVFTKKELSKEYKRENILKNFKFDKKVKTGLKVVTNAFGLFGEINTKELKDFNIGEMESYYVAKLSDKLKTPFGCLLICSDTGEELLMESIKKLIIIKDLDKRLKELVGNETNSERLLNKLKKEKTLDEAFRLYSKTRRTREASKLIREKHVNQLDNYSKELAEVLIDLIDDIQYL